jgi:hypothetical protein
MVYVIRHAKIYSIVKGLKQKSEKIFLLSDQ